MRNKPSEPCVGDIVTVHPKNLPPDFCRLAHKHNGAPALVCRECPYTLFVWVRFFMHSEDPVYRLHEFGPYSKSELKPASASTRRLFAPMISKLTPPSFERLVQT